MTDSCYHKKSCKTKSYFAGYLSEKDKLRILNNINASHKALVALGKAAAQSSLL